MAAERLKHDVENCDQQLRFQMQMLEQGLESKMVTMDLLNREIRGLREKTDA